MSGTTPSTGSTDIGRRRLTLPQQALGLRSRFPAGTVRLDRRSLSFTGKLTPSPLSRTYTVAITYRLGGGSPTITVLHPELIRPPESELPHVYEDDLLCLHLPGEWTADMLLATTTVPWAAEWLLHYELWLSTDGTWCGGGQH